MVCEDRIGGITQMKKITPYVDVSQETPSNLTKNRSERFLRGCSDHML